jgi:Uncharacterised protein family (UPF0158)
MAKARIVVRAEALIEALETGHPDVEWVLDLRTGEVSGLFDPEMSGEEADALLRQTIEGDPGRFVFIDPIPSHESFRAMERFTEALPAGPSCTALLLALRLKDPFRTFKDTLVSYPHIREDWFRFKDEWLMACAREWLSSNVPNATLVTGPVPTGEA